ncbi:IS1595 family transposase [Pedobacter sp. KR3-3]|uniref:IS1595 family transposase n=1 Tax=Pedobacter albus TaxID=3113905 RepID=A0ABU7IB78_9SPHI|nr:IS1595 family transposase [Pedobacter sp. KR3-3]MEE1946712.1 IS1595 family transposase [Pedobacter sp. KR3-3]
MQCPYEGCGNDKSFVFKDGIRYKCTCCRKIYTAKTGTIFEGSKLRLITWFMGLYLVMHKKGISSVQLAKDLGITQKTAWFMLQRLRTVLGNEEAPLMEGTVEIDESFVGGKSKFRHRNKRIKYNPGRAYKDKTPVFGMLERGGKVRAMVVPNVLMVTIRQIALENIRTGASIMGDGFHGYRALEVSYKVRCTDHGKGYYGDGGELHTNAIENFWSHMKRSLTAVYIRVTPKHLNKYVQESVFRYNYRNLSIQQLFDKFIENFECRLKYKQLIA